MFKYANETLSYQIYANLHRFPEQKSKHWIKPGLTFLFLRIKCYINQAMNDI